MRAVVLCALALTLAVVPAARAERTLLSANAVGQVGAGEIEGPCGLAATPGRIYVSSYYRHQVSVFSSSGLFEFAIPTDPIEGPCGLAVSATDALYVNRWHQGVDRLRPSTIHFDSAESTGVAVDQASGDFYVNDRTYVAVYAPSGAPVMVEGEPGGEPEPLRIGLGTLGDGYGVAVASGKVYVPDAADHTVKVYEPALDPAVPVKVLQGPLGSPGGFNSLVDAAVAVDPTNGHLLVLDNLQPGFEHPEAALYEFDAAGNFLDGISQRVIDGEPSGLAFDGSQLFVTNGNSEGGAVYKFGAYFASVPGSSIASSGGEAPAAPSAAGEAARATGSAAVAIDGAAPAKLGRRHVKHRHRVKVGHRHLPRGRGARTR